MANNQIGISKEKAVIKRFFDVLFSIMVLSVTWWVILIAFIIATIDTGQNGFFTQLRVGRNKRYFKIFKIRTMRSDQSINTTVTTVTTALDPRVSKIGRFLRKTNIDELPQFLNVLMGQMSVVGPRADVPGFYDELTGSDSFILSVRPGITGPATIKYRDEEKVLAKQQDPDAYNYNVIFPDKVRINKEYIENWSLLFDIRCIWITIIGTKL